MHLIKIFRLMTRHHSSPSEIGNAGKTRHQNKLFKCHLYISCMKRGNLSVLILSFIFKDASLTSNVIQPLFIYQLITTRFD